MWGEVLLLEGYILSLLLLMFLSTCSEVGKGESEPGWNLTQNVRVAQGRKEQLHDTYGCAKIQHPLSHSPSPVFLPLYEWELRRRMVEVAGGFVQARLGLGKERELFGYLRKV